MAPSDQKRLAGRKIVAFACFDSFGKLAMTLLETCRRQGADTTLYLLEINNRTLSRRQRLEIRRIDPRTRIEKLPWNDLRSLAGPMVGDVDALILGLDGQRSRDALLQLKGVWSGSTPRPLLVSAYPGILFRFALEGMLDRAGADLLCLNSEHDLATYSAGCQALGMDCSNAVVTGLPILWRVKPAIRETTTPLSIVFFEQPSIPVHPLQRRFLCDQLLELAAAWPDHPVIFKPRTSSIESTLHRRHGEMSSVISAMTRSQPNLKLSFKPATQLLRCCGCAITVSSTAALESMAMGISTRIVGDLGVTETLGNHFFAASGAVADFATIREDPFKAIHDRSWLERQGLIPGGEQRFIDAMAERMDHQLQPIGGEGIGPVAWGSQAWQKAALKNGGRRMLSSGGARSSQRKRHHTRRVLRNMRDGLVGFGRFSRLFRK